MLDLIEMELDHETVVFRDSAVKSIQKLSPWRLQAAFGEIDPLLGVRHPRSERPKDCPTTGPQDVADDFGQLHICVSSVFWMR
jgi:hypothetical protein